VHWRTIRGLTATLLGRVIAPSARRAARIGSAVSLRNRRSTQSARSLELRFKKAPCAAGKDRPDVAARYKLCKAAQSFIDPNNPGLSRRECAAEERKESQ
jgi:hypothetical protein